MVAPRPARVRARSASGRRRASPRECRAAPSPRSTDGGGRSRRRSSSSSASCCLPLIVADRRATAPTALHRRPCHRRSADRDRCERCRRPDDHRLAGSRASRPASRPRLRSGVSDPHRRASPLVRWARAARGPGSGHLGGRRSARPQPRNRSAARPRVHRRSHAVRDRSSGRGGDLQAPACPERPRDDRRRREPPERRHWARPLRDRRRRGVRAGESRRRDRFLRRDRGHQRRDRRRDRVPRRPESWVWSTTT